MKIIELRAENVKKVVAVSIHPGEDPIVEVTGDNGAGKSSVLDSIMYALGGKDTQPPEVIRRGEKHAEVVVDLGEYVVKRRWTPSGSTLNVESKEGARFPSPQSMLDKLIGGLSFDPLAFIRLDPKKQAETVRALVGIDTAAVEAEYKEAYDLRARVKAEGVSMRARFDAMPAPSADVPDVPVSVQDLLAEQTRMQAEKAINDKLRFEARDLAKDFLDTKTASAAAEADVIRIEAELTAAKLRAQQKNADEEAAQIALDEANAALEEIVDPDLTAINSKISGAEAVNAAVRAKQARAALEVELNKKREEVVALQEKVDAIVEKKTKMLADAKFPIAGMSFSAGGLTYKDLPLEQASQAEQIRVGMAMGLALNPKLKVVLIRDASLLDNKSLKLVAEMAAEANAQVWLERVASGTKVGFEIVEGFVASHDGVAVARPEAVVKLTADSEPGKPALALVPPPAPSPAQPATPKANVPTFKKRPIPELTGEELTAAIAEVESAINSSPMSAKSTQHRAKLEDLKAEMNSRLDAAMGDAPEPGSAG